MSISAMVFELYKFEIYILASEVKVAKFAVDMSGFRIICNVLHVVITFTLSLIQPYGEI